VPPEPSWSHRPLQSVSDSEVVGVSGSPLPVRPWRSQATGPSGIPPSALVQGRDSLDVPLMRFDPPSRSPRSPPSSSRSEGNSPGVRAPTALKEARVHVRSRCDRPPKWLSSASQAPRELPGNPLAVPMSPATVPLSGFPNLSAAFLLSLPPYHFQVGGARGVCPSGACSFREAPAARHRQHALVALFLPVARAPFLGGSTERLAGRYLGCLDQRSFFAFRAFVLTEIGRSSSHV